DWKAGDLKKEYRQITKPDLALSPIPRWDSLENQMKYYIQGAVQTTRGCPFDCEFCDVIYLFGRRTRSKPIDKVLEEVSVLERLGMERIFFCDDNFIGNRSYTKELLRELIPLNNSFRKPILFSTQLSIDLAQNEELLELMADANFGTLYIGIESPNKESLKETNKLQNVRSDLIEDCKKIMSYGMVIRAAMIVGFDNDDTSIFDQHFEFTQKSHIPLASTALLNAFTGTRLWRRLLAEGRLLSRSEAYKEGQTRLGRTNIIPKRMTRVELLSGYLDLLKRNHDWDNFAARVKEMASNVKRKPNVPQKSEPEEGLSSAAVNTFLFSLDEKARNAIISIFLHTRQHAPFMMEKVLGITLQQYSKSK
ncbi:MAG: radical SAM protein, partial [Candidatus Poribacteria bacterium]